MVVGVLGTLLSAGLTRFGAELAEGCCQWTVTRHEGSCKPAKISAVAVESDTTGHHFDVIFL